MLNKILHKPKINGCYHSTSNSRFWLFFHDAALVIGIVHSSFANDDDGDDRYFTLIHIISHLHIHIQIRALPWTKFPYHIIKNMKEVCDIIC